MKTFFLWVLCAGLLGLVACARRPMTDDEFRGFCYSSYGRKTSCDTIPLCNAFESALSQQYTDRGACLDGCEKVYDKLYVTSFDERCLNSLGQANRLCNHYCVSNFPEQR